MTILTDEQVRALLDGSTPGPWRLIDDPEAGEPAQCIRAKGWDIATAWGGYSAAESDANLLCAAPDLARDLLDARAELARLRHEIQEASDPDFLFGAMDNVNDMGVGLDDFAKAASRAIRAALSEAPEVR
jgi:hypothetical protein